MNDLPMSSVELHLQAARLRDLAVDHLDGHAYSVALSIAESISAAALREQPEIPPRINIKCEAVFDGGIGATTSLNVLRVEREDDDSFTAVTDHWPEARGVVDAIPEAVCVLVGWRIRRHTDGSSITFQGPDSRSATIVPPHSPMFPLLYALLTAVQQP